MDVIQFERIEKEISSALTNFFPNYFNIFSTRNIVFSKNRIDFLNDLFSQVYLQTEGKCLFSQTNSYYKILLLFGIATVKHSFKQIFEFPNKIDYAVILVNSFNIFFHIFGLIF